ncbi:MAG: hypothetical protein KKA42_16535 [candidate division Zixibacteria bacterium]|nr:hypothetical protein [candidate division Zixibacteria bacterium]
MKRVVTKVGFIYSVKLDAKSKKYFQYVDFDNTMLGSPVIRAFAKVYPIAANPTMDEIVKGEVEFYAHCFVSWGVKMGLWEKVGKHKEVGVVDTLFRFADDFEVEVSENWYVFEVNGELQHVGKLKGRYQKAEFGEVMPPDEIVHRMRTCEYSCHFPAYE